MNPRDGIGLETYLNGKCVMEIFRDDTEKRTYVTVYAESIDLDVLEASITQFNVRINSDYMEYPADQS